MRPELRVKNMNNRQEINARVIKAAEHALARKGFVSTIDILLGLDFISQTGLHEWKIGKFAFFESLISGNPRRIEYALECFQRWITHKNLATSMSVYRSVGTANKKELRFSKTGNPKTEEAYKTHYVSPELNDQKKEKRVKDKLNQSE